jgi:hypothetical protein
MKLVQSIKRRAVACAIGSVLVVGACSASGASTRTKPAPAPTATAACSHALDLADILLDESAQTVRIDSQIFEGTASVTNSAARLSQLAASQLAIKPNYLRAKAACRASR